MMAFNERDLESYVDVAQRIADFREQYPHGSLQPADPAMPYHVVRVPSGWCRQCIGRRSVKSGGQWKACPRCQGSGVREAGEPTEDIFIVYTAAAYRTPDDPRPGVGIAWEPFPGQTPYTAQSELMNSETSAWGRAIVAVLASDSKAGVASRQEVKARRAEREDGLPVNADGSLSRSRTTDAEKDAAGVMTAGQQAEHTALGGGHPNERKTPKGERGKTLALHPCDCNLCRSLPEPWMIGRDAVDGDHPQRAQAQDPWFDQSAGQLPDVEHKPGTIHPGQQRTIMAAFKGRDRAERMAYVSALAGRDVTSTNDLSYAEAQLVVAGLGRDPVKP